MLKIGLTGGIGSGKTTVAGIFEILGIPVYYADETARLLMNKDPQLKEKIIFHFGDAAYKEGVLDRRYMRQQVFNNEQKLTLLNSLVHPATIRDSEDWMAQQTTPYAIKEAALVFESSIYQQLDYVIGVYAPELLRIQRTMKRDHISRDEVLKFMKNQMNEEEKIKRCDFVIHNDEVHPVIPQTLGVHQKILGLAGQQ